jgi:nitrogen fixation protein NifX
MKVAFTSSDGRMVDQHFGTTRDFFVWEVGPEGAAFVSKVTALTTSEAHRGAPSSERGFAAGADLDEEDRIAARASAIAGCAIVYTVQIGGPAAAKLVARRIHPMKTAAEIPVAEVVAKLQEVLRGTPPPWLRKALGAGAPKIAEECGCE